MVKQKNSKKHTWKLDKGEVITRHLRKTKRKIVGKKLKNAKNMELDVLIGGGDWKKHPFMDARLKGKSLFDDGYQVKLKKLNLQIEFLNVWVERFNTYCQTLTETIQEKVEMRAIKLLSIVFRKGVEDGLLDKNIKEVSELRMKIYKYVYGVDSENSADLLTGNKWGRNVLKFEVCGKYGQTGTTDRTGADKGIVAIVTLFSGLTLIVARMLGAAWNTYKKYPSKIECQVSMLRFLESEISRQILKYTKQITEFMDQIDVKTTTAQFGKVIIQLRDKHTKTRNKDAKDIKKFDATIAKLVGMNATLKKINTSTLAITKKIKEFYTTAFPGAEFTQTALKGIEHKASTGDAWATYLNKRRTKATKQVSKHSSQLQYDHIENMRKNMSRDFNAESYKFNANHYINSSGRQNNYSNHKYLDTLQETIVWGYNSGVLNDTDYVARLDLGAICFGDNGQYLNKGFIVDGDVCVGNGKNDDANKECKNFWFISDFNKNLNKKDRIYAAKMFRVPKYVLGIATADLQDAKNKGKFVGVDFNKFFKIPDTNDNFNNLNDLINNNKNLFYEAIVYNDFILNNYDIFWGTFAHICMLRELVYNKAGATRFKTSYTENILNDMKKIANDINIKIKDPVEHDKVTNYFTEKARLLTIIADRQHRLFLEDLDYKLWTLLHNRNYYGLHIYKCNNKLLSILDRYVDKSNVSNLKHDLEFLNRIPADQIINVFSTARDQFIYRINGAITNTGNFGPVTGTPNISSQPTRQPLSPTSPTSHTGSPLPTTPLAIASPATAESAIPPAQLSEEINPVVAETSIPAPHLLLQQNRREKEEREQQAAAILQQQQAAILQQQQAAILQQQQQPPPATQPQPPPPAPPPATAQSAIPTTPALPSSATAPLPSSATAQLLLTEQQQGATASKNHIYETPDGNLTLKVGKTTNNTDNSNFSGDNISNSLDIPSTGNPQQPQSLLEASTIAGQKTASEGLTSFKNPSQTPKNPSFFGRIFGTSKKGGSIKSKKLHKSHKKSLKTRNKKSKKHTKKLHKSHRKSSKTHNNKPNNKNKNKKSH